MVDKIEKGLKLIKTKVCFEDYYDNQDPDLIYSCFIYAEDEGWNGWARPFFLKEERDKFLKNMQREYADNEFISQIKAVKPKIVNGLDLYDMSCGCCWDIEDDNFKQRREEALRHNVNAIFF